MFSRRKAEASKPEDADDADNGEDAESSMVDNPQAKMATDKHKVHDCINYTVQRAYSPDFVKVIFRLRMLTCKPGMEEKKNVLSKKRLAQIESSLSIQPNGEMGVIQVPKITGYKEDILVAIKINPTDVGYGWLPAPDSYFDFYRDEIHLYLKKKL